MKKRAAIVLAVLMAGFPPTAIKSGPESSAEARLSTAQGHFREGRFDEAVQAYRKILERDASHVEAHVGLGRALLKKDDLEEAHRAAQKAMQVAPAAAAVRAVLGDVMYRQADFEKATAAYLVAVSRDSRHARGHLGLGKILASEARHKSAKANFEKAYELDPEDPEIILAWYSTRKDRDERIQALERYLEKAKNEEEYMIRAVRSRLDVLKKLGDKKTFRLQGGSKTARIKLELLHSGSRLDYGYGVQVAFNNGKSYRLLLDTGASGVLIHRKAAEKIGVEFLAGSFVYGAGDEGDKDAYVGLVGSMRVGAFEFKDCTVSVTDRKSIGDTAGIIGTDVFARFLVRLDFPRRVLELEPFPEPEGAGDPDEEAPMARDRQITQANQDFTPVRHILGKLLVRTQVNGKQATYFMIDSGASMNFISESLARAVTDVSIETRMQAKGVSGEIKKLHRADRVLLEFGGIRQQNIDMISFDFKKLNKRMGTEVSGLIGHPALKQITLIIDYRNGLVNFNYRP